MELTADLEIPEILIRTALPATPEEYALDRVVRCPLNKILKNLVIEKYAIDKQFGF